MKIRHIFSYCFSQSFPFHRIRNFCIISHIDHGKSTLADRLLQLTNTIPKNSSNQYLDKLKVQRQRGITVQAQTASMYYQFEGEQYLLNLVDTPGHIDFNYEVQRSMRSCQGALLLVDATQGIQAQTLANYQLAKKQKLQIIPVLNKIDVICDILQIQASIRNELHLNQISQISAKTGLNISTLLKRIIKEIPPPRVGNQQDPLKIFLINSWHVNNKNVICLFYIISGELKKNITIVSSAFCKNYQIFDVGILQPQTTTQTSLKPGQIGYVLSNMKQVKQAKIGDTFYKLGSKVIPQPGFKPSKPMMYAGVYPLDQQDFSLLERSLGKLVLTDPAVTYVQESSATLGNGFRCGFLGMLHMDVFKQRLIDQYHIQAILTSPSVPYKCKLKNGKIIHVDCAMDSPNKSQVLYYEQPFILATCVFPKQYLTEVKNLCFEKRGIQYEQILIQDRKYIYRCHLPLSEIIVDFMDRLKSITHGYGSFEYDHENFREAKITKIVIYLMNDPVDALTFLVHEKRAFQFGKSICQKLKQTIPEQLFTVSIQARIGSRTIAKEQIPHIKKHVTAKCYGGDYSRKKKLIQRYKEGKKKLKAIGKVQVSNDTFLHLMKQ